MQCSIINIFWLLETTFNDYILLKAAIYYFRWLYTTYGGYMLLSTAIYYFQRLYTTFSLIWLWFCKDPTLSCNFPYLRFEFSISLLALIQFCFFCSSMDGFFIISNVPFWKCCFIRNTQMLKMGNFHHLVLQIVCKASK